MGWEARKYRPDFEKKTQSVLCLFAFIRGKNKSQVVTANERE